VEPSLGKQIRAMEQSIADRFNHLEDAAKVFDEWKPKVDASVPNLRAELGATRKSEAMVEQLHEEMTALRKTVSPMVLNSDPSASAGVLKSQPMVAVVTSSARHPTISPFVGHNAAHHHWGFEPMAQRLVKGKLIETLP